MNPDIDYTNIRILLDKLNFYTLDEQTYKHNKPVIHDLLIKSIAVLYSQNIKDMKATSAPVPSTLTQLEMIELSATYG